MIAYAPAWAVWLALGLWGLAIVVGVVAFIMARRLWRQIRPMVEPYLMMFSGGSAKMGAAAAGTGNVQESADSSPAAVATPDRCEYEDHEWSTPYNTGQGYAAHNCRRCGYIEPVPGQ